MRERKAIQAERTGPMMSPAPEKAYGRERSVEPHMVVTEENMMCAADGPEPGEGCERSVDMELAGERGQ
jgi:hypothetical protein